MSACLACDVDHHHDCPSIAEEDFGIEADQDGWYTIWCCCGLAVDSAQTTAADAEYAEELRRRGWSQPSDPGPQPGGGRLMGFQVSDHDSAAAALARVRELPSRLDLDHPDPAYQAGKADQLVRAAAALAHDLRVLAVGRRLRDHLVEIHGRVELAARQHTADGWASDHLDDHHAGVPAGTPHRHDDERSTP